MNAFIFFNIVIVSFICCGVSALQLRVCHAESDKPWSYNNHLKNGPDGWAKHYPSCNGHYQSPINIETESVVADWNLPELELRNYNKPVTFSTVINNGYAVILAPNDGIERSIKIEGVVYKLVKLHFHWGDGNFDGTEHKIDGKQYAMEVHFIHSDRRGKLAIVGVLYKESERYNSGLRPVIDNLERVLYQGKRVKSKSTIHLDTLIEERCLYFRYMGSLTSPNCTEGVIWTICRNPLTISQDQLMEFRELYSTTRKDKNKGNCKITSNIRPIKPLNGRTVKSSIKENSKIN